MNNLSLKNVKSIFTGENFVTKNGDIRKMQNTLILIKHLSLKKIQNTF